MSSETKTVSYPSTGPYNESDVTAETSANDMLQCGLKILKVNLDDSVWF